MAIKESGTKISKDTEHRKVTDESARSEHKEVSQAFANRKGKEDDENVKGRVKEAQISPKE